MKLRKETVGFTHCHVMVLAMSISTFADETNTDVKNAAAKGTGNFSITMTGAEDGHTFEAYRIFDGAVDKSGKLSDIVWAKGVETTGIAAALANADLTAQDGENLSIAADVA